jgi:hypothetical protein
MTIKTGLYDECPCGSGKIYKKCCIVKDAGNTVNNPILSDEDDIIKYAVFAEKWDRAKGPVPSFRQYMGMDDVNEGRMKFYRVKIISGIKAFLGRIFNRL